MRELRVTCENYCGSCDKNMKECEAYKERSRQVNREIYAMRKAYKANKGV